MNNRNVTGSYLSSLACAICIYWGQSEIGSEADCRPRGHEFDPGLVPHFSTVILTLPLIQERVGVSYKPKYVLRSNG